MANRKLSPNKTGQGKLQLIVEPEKIEEEASKLTPQDLAVDDSIQRVAQALFAGAKVEVRTNAEGGPIVEIDGLPMHDVREIKILMTVHGSELHIRQRIKAGTDKVWVDSWRDFFVPNPNIYSVAKRPEPSKE